MRYIVLQNDKSYRRIVIDTYAARVSRMRRRIMQWGRVLANTQNIVYKFITLTYRDDEEWKANQINEYMRQIKKNSGVLAAAWVLELTKKGRPHYHIMVVLKKGSFLDHVEAWSKGFYWITTVRTPWYLISYLKKSVAVESMGDLPKGSRIFAVSITEELAAQKKELWFLNLKPWAQRLIEDEGEEYYRWYLKQPYYSAWRYISGTNSKKDADWYLSSTGEIDRELLASEIL